MLTRTDARTLVYPPGQRWQYSNIGYLYVRRLIEAETGERLDTALHRLVLDPLDLPRPRIIETSEEWRSTLSDHGSYDPGWVYHGLLVGSLADAAAVLNRIFSSALLPDPLLQAMRDSYPFAQPFPNRPWIAPGYGLGLMTSTDEGGAMLAGHTGAGPGSVIAVYHSFSSGATAATFSGGDDQGVVEREVVRLLRPRSSRSEPSLPG